MELEFALDGIQTNESYPFSIEAHRPSLLPTQLLTFEPSNVGPRTPALRTSG